jgi:hypothetical protein
MEDDMRVLVAAAMMIAMVTVPARAEGEPQSAEWRMCTANSGVTVEQKLAACTAALAQPDMTGPQLAIVLVRRGWVYRSRPPGLR